MQAGRCQRAPGLTAGFSQGAAPDRYGAAQAGPLQQLHQEFGGEWRIADQEVAIPDPLQLGRDRNDILEFRGELHGPRTFREFHIHAAIGDHAAIDVIEGMFRPLQLRFGSDPQCGETG